MADLEDMIPAYDERTKRDVCALPEAPSEPPTKGFIACCANCAFMRSDGRHAECHRFAPRPVVNGKTPAAVWPEVIPTEWCGDYKLKGS